MEQRCVGYIFLQEVWITDQLFRAKQSVYRIQHENEMISTLPRGGHVDNRTILLW
jgi:hypothetical protein